MGYIWRKLPAGYKFPSGRFGDDFAGNRINETERERPVRARRALPQYHAFPSLDEPFQRPLAFDGRINDSFCNVVSGVRLASNDPLAISVPHCIESLLQALDFFRSERMLGRQIAFDRHGTPPCDSMANGPALSTAGQLALGYEIDP